MTQDVTFQQKSYGEFTQVKKTVVVNTGYEGSNEEEELKMVSIINNKNNINVVGDSDSDLSEEDFKNMVDNYFNKDVNNQVKISPQTTVNAKVV